ncbi:MAG: phage tail sheath subtilisin-like domain-containing protein [Methylobacter sp.]|nr:phage tail sheath subtilisin-like domain-containing protein [Candidatus Methylobacter titanis]
MTRSLLNSFGDFERQFGGLAVDYPLSYSVRDFYLNGGSQAIIVRLYKAPSTATDDKAKLTVDGLNITAKSPGVWGKKLRATFDVEVSDEVRTRLGLAASDALFNLTIRLGNTSEKFLNVTVTDNARRIDRVLKAESSLVQWPEGVAWPGTAPTMTKTKAAAVAYKELLAAPNDAAKKTAYEAAKVDLDDDATKAEKELAAALAAKPQVPADITTAQAKIKTAEDNMKGSDGGALDQAAYEGQKVDKTGLYALDKADLFNLLCFPPDTREGNTPIAVYQTAMSYCKERRALLIVDAPAEWSANKDTAAAKARHGLATLGLSGETARNAALYFPRVLEADPLRDGQIDTFVPCGIIAGIMARTDTNRGVWKAPAGLDASINGIQGVNVTLNDAENGMLNPLGINCLRAFPTTGRVVWGARTLRGADQLADEWKYIPVRRTALFIEESLYRGTQWVVFEPNDEPLWAQIRLNIGAFMHNLFRQGAFQGSTPREAYFVKCDKETTTQTDINSGIVNIVVGFAPLKPAEFVVIKLQQMAGQIEV